MRHSLPESKGEVRGSWQRRSRGAGRDGEDAGKEGRARPGRTTVRAVPLLFHCCLVTSNNLES